MPDINIARLTDAEDDNSLYVYGDDDDFMSLSASIQDANHEKKLLSYHLVAVFTEEDFKESFDNIQNIALQGAILIPVSEFLRDFKKFTVSSLMRGEYKMNAQEYTDEELIKISRTSSSPVTKELGYRLQRLLDTIKKLTGDKAK